MTKTLILRTCTANLTSRNGFQWPETGHIEAPDWNPEPHCGNGLHGLHLGEGAGQLLDWDPAAKWLIVETELDTLVDLGGKVKFPSGNVVHCGDRQSATEYLAADPRSAGRSITGGTATAGDRGTATAGYRGTATAGDRGTATAGDRGTATAGHGGTATAGEAGVLAIHWYDAERGTYRVEIDYIGEIGLDPDIAYHLNDEHNFEPVEVPEDDAS
mgnify:FL=1